MGSPPFGNEAAALGSVSLVARFQAFVYAQRNALAAAPLLLAFLSKDAGVAGAASWVLALLLASLGAALRAWSTLYNRYAQGQAKSLATGGPYARVRNPIYLGNALVIAGCFAASGRFGLLALGMAWAFLVYDQVVRHEERRLLQKYGAAYALYCRSVPRWIPRFVAEPLRPLPVPFGPALLVQSRSLLFLLPFVVRAWALLLLSQVP